MKKIKNKKNSHSATRFKNINYQSKITSIPLEIVELEDNSYHLVTAVEINGITGDVIIDTGASVTVLDKKIIPDVAEDNLTVRMQSGSVSGQINDVKVITIESFKIGHTKIKNMQIAAIDLNYVNEMYEKHLNRKIIGLLGCDFCVKHQVVIDYRNQCLTFKKSL